jgi:hypothetical protein
MCILDSIIFAKNIGQRESAVEKQKRKKEGRVCKDFKKYKKQT